MNELERRVKIVLDLGIEIMRIPLLQNLPKGLRWFFLIQDAPSGHRVSLSRLTGG